MYIQHGNLFSMRSINIFPVVIAENRFYNISFAGPLIYFEGADRWPYRIAAILDNSFELIHGYIDTMIIKIKNTYINST